MQKKQQKKKQHFHHVLGERCMDKRPQKNLQNIDRNIAGKYGLYIYNAEVDISESVHKNTFRKMKSQINNVIKQTL